MKQNHSIYKEGEEKIFTAWRKQVATEALCGKT